jgi:hypothetical protein
MNGFRKSLITKDKAKRSCILFALFSFIASSAGVALSEHLRTCANSNGVAQTDSNKLKDKAHLKRSKRNSRKSRSEDSTHELFSELNLDQLSEFLNLDSFDLHLSAEAPKTYSASLDYSFSKLRKDSLLPKSLTLLSDKSSRAPPLS